MSYYLVRVGRGSKYADVARKYGFVAIQFTGTPNLDPFNDVEGLKKYISARASDKSPDQVANKAGQLFRFGKLLKDGDAVLTPLGDGQYLVGKLGSYYYEEDPKDGCPFKHRRSVVWEEKLLSKEDCSSGLAYALGAQSTVFSLDKYSNELDNLLTGTKIPVTARPQRIRDMVLDGLRKLNGEEFEKFVQYLLEILGFHAETTPYVADKGIDVSGVLDAEGLAEITLKVQVKRVSGPIGNKGVLAIRGALSQSEHPCLITLSKFTAQAREEAEALGKVPVKLLDGDDLADLILKHFDEIDESYRKLFSIRKKRDLNIEEQFEATASG